MNGSARLTLVTSRFLAHTGPSERGGGKSLTRMQSEIAQHGPGMPILYRGYFNDILDAIMARQSAEQELHPYRGQPRLDAYIIALPPGLPADILAEWKLDVRRLWKLPPRIHWRRSA